MPDPSSDPRRIAFPKLLTEMGLLGQGVEIGVFTGWHSALILGNWPGKVYGVDHYKQEPFFRDDRDINWFHYTPKRWASIKKRAEEALGPYGDRFELLHMGSFDASKRFEDGSLDWVYVDGSHYKEAVALDIDLWLPKIRAGGVIAGHDYYNGTKKARVEVKEAVDTYFGDRVRVWDTGELPSWYVLL